MMKILCYVFEWNVFVYIKIQGQIEKYKKNKDNRLTGPRSEPFLDNTTTPASNSHTLPSTFTAPHGLL